jgi:hypothetical protein
MMASTPSPRFTAAIERFDALNAQDPSGKEPTYARRMTQWLEKLSPDASEPLRLAARSQHLMRWQIPRDSFPMDRIGYLKWRTTLYDFHADKAADVLREVGYDNATIARVRSLIRKEKLKVDPEMQLLEDVICLVFLENYFAEFARDHDEDKLVRILQKTWKKMSPRGHEAAIGLKLGEREKQLIALALTPRPTGGEAT